MSRLAEWRAITHPIRAAEFRLAHARDINAEIAAERAAAAPPEPPKTPERVEYERLRETHPIAAAYYLGANRARIYAPGDGNGSPPPAAA